VASDAFPTFTTRCPDDLSAQVCFAADEALAELRRFGLLREAGEGECVGNAGEGVGGAGQRGSGASGGPWPAPLGAGSGGAADQLSAAPGAQPATAPAPVLPTWPAISRGREPRYTVVPAREGVELLRCHWGRLLDARVGDILQGLAPDG
jgi:hypothetical protein